VIFEWESMLFLKLFDRAPSRSISISTYFRRSPTKTRPKFLSGYLISAKKKFIFIYLSFYSLVDTKLVLSNCIFQLLTPRVCMVYFSRDRVLS
jgi:hypothetical protein